MMRLHAFNPTSGWTNPVCSTLLTRTVKRYALLPPEFMFAAAGAGTISVPRTFKAVTTPIRRAETFFNGDTPQFVGVRQTFGGIFVDDVRIHPRPRVALVGFWNPRICRAVRFPRNPAGLCVESRSSRVVATASGPAGNVAGRRRGRRA